MHIGMIIPVSDLAPVSRSSNALKIMELPYPLALQSEEHGNKDFGYQNANVKYSVCCGASVPVLQLSNHKKQ